MSFNNPSWYTRFEEEIIQHRSWYKDTVSDYWYKYLKADEQIINRNYPIENYVHKAKSISYSSYTLWDSELGRIYFKRKLEEYLKIHFPFSLPSSPLIQYLLQFL